VNAIVLTMDEMYVVALVLGCATEDGDKDPLLNQIVKHLDPDAPGKDPIVWDMTAIVKVHEALDQHLVDVADGPFARLVPTGAALLKRLDAGMVGSATS